MHLGAEQFHPGGVGAGQLALHVQRHRTVEHRLGGFHLRRAGRELELGVLERCHRRAEGLAVLGVVDGRGDGRARLGHRADRYRQPLLRQVVPEIAERLVHLPQHVGRGHPNVDERQFGGVLDLAAHLLEFPSPGETVHSVLHDQQSQASASVVRVRRRAGDDHHQVGLHTAGDECLGTVDDEMVPVSYRGGAHAGQIRAGTGLGHRDRGEQRARRQSGEPPLPLFGVGVVQEVGQDHLQLGAHGRQGHQRPGGFFLQHHVVAVVGFAAAAVLLGDRHSEHAERTHLLEDLARHPAALLPQRIVGHDLFLDEVARQLAERLVVLGEQVSAHVFLPVSGQAISSTSVALAVPPPSHMVCSP